MIAVQLRQIISKKNQNFFSQLFHNYTHPDAFWLVVKLYVDKTAITACMKSDIFVIYTERLE